jgi:hypothetical protein
MGATKRVGHCALIPRRGGPHHDQAVGELATVAQRAVQGRADASISLDWVLDPWCWPERWTMTHVLAVVALEQRRPVAEDVSYEADDPAQHADKRTGEFSVAAALATDLAPGLAPNALPRVHTGCTNRYCSAGSRINRRPLTTSRALDTREHQAPPTRDGGCCPPCFATPVRRSRRWRGPARSQPSARTQNRCLRCPRRERFRGCSYRPRCRTASAPTPPAPRGRT